MSIRNTIMTETTAIATLASTGKVSRHTSSPDSSFSQTCAAEAIGKEEKANNPTPKVTTMLFDNIVYSSTGELCASAGLVQIFEL